MATGLNNEVAILTKLKQMENTFGLAGPGHYNEVASLKKWPLSEGSLYLPCSKALSDNQCEVYKIPRNIGSPWVLVHCLHQP